MNNKIKSNEKYGEFTTIKKVKYITSGGRTEVRWKCLDDLGQIRYQRVCQLHTRNISKRIIKANKKYGEFTTIKKVKYLTQKGNIEYRWKCKDSLGKIIYHRTDFLGTRHIKRRNKYIIKAGKKYGEFIAMKRVKRFFKTGRIIYTWKCIDDEGRIKYCRNSFLIKREKNPANKKTIIEKGKQCGEFIPIKKVKNYITKGGRIESRWMCKDGNGTIKYFRNYLLICRINNNKIREKQNKNHIKKVAKLVKGNRHQMGVRNRFYYEYKQNSEKRGISFRLSFKLFNSIIINNCHYCGAEPSICNRWNKTEHKGQPKLKYNGVDRISSTGGYNKKNTVPCCAKCNLMKNVFETDDFLGHISKIYKYKNNKNKIK